MSKTYSGVIAPKNTLRRAYTTLYMCGSFLRSTAVHVRARTLNPKNTCMHDYYTPAKEQRYVTLY